MFSRSAALRRAAKSGAYWDRWQEGDIDDEVAFFMAVPEVRLALNRRVSGAGEIDYFGSFLDQLSNELAEPLSRALSLGCGSGSVERHLAARGLAREIVGVDIGETSLSIAEQLAAAAGLGDAIRYELADAETYLERETGRFDAVFCHAVLHHIERLEPILDSIREHLQRPSGFLYVWEFVGPSRDEWGDADLFHARQLFASIPNEYRRTPEVWPPLDINDPTEQIRSSEIDGMLRERFRVTGHWPMYGNITAPLVSAIRKSCIDEPIVKRAIEKAIELEDRLGASGEMKPHYAAYRCELF